VYLSRILFSTSRCFGDNGHRPRSRNAYKEVAFPAGDDGSSIARDDRIGPDLASARRLLDAAGALISDARTRADHQGSGSAGAVEADFLLDAAIAIIAAVNERGPGGFAASKSLHILRI
jgi:hypothetical protein